MLCLVVVSAFTQKQFFFRKKCNETKEKSECISARYVRSLLPTTSNDQLKNFVNDKNVFIFAFLLFLFCTKNTKNTVKNVYGAIFSLSHSIHSHECLSMQKARRNLKIHSHVDYTSLLAFRFQSERRTIDQFVHSNFSFCRRSVSKLV